MKVSVVNPLANLSRSLALGFLFLATILAGFSQTAVPNAGSHSTDDEALRAVVAGFSDGWNRHDAHAMCASLADDVKWVGWNGSIALGRQKVQDGHAKLFTGNYSQTHRTDVVKSIEYLTPTLAAVDDYWTMIGSRRRDGTEWPYRAGYASFLVAKRGDQWIVIESHTADFNAKEPAAK
jgi:uncharacterized protein (TIGR02246 family)